jgi:hypothetical protein
MGFLEVWRWHIMIPRPWFSFGKHLMKLGQLRRKVPNLKFLNLKWPQRILKQAADGVRDPVRLRASAFISVEGAKFTG